MIISRGVHLEAADLALFAHVVRQSEEQIDLAKAALLLAEPEYPGLDVSLYLDRLESLGARAQALVVGLDGERAVARLLSFLYGELGFVGNALDYYDPRNSFLNEVLDRKTGIPITLAVVFLEVARRAAIDAQGIAFPGHFLLRVPVAGGFIVIDPFIGDPLGMADLRQLYQTVTGRQDEPGSELLAPASKTEMLLRMLGNLRSIYAKRGDSERLCRALERIVILNPADTAAAKEIELLRGRLSQAERLLH